MSAKTNRLRNRLRMQMEQFKSRARAIQREEMHAHQLAVDAKALADRIHRKAALTIIIDELPPGLNRCPPMLGLSIHLVPEMFYLRAMIKDPLANLTCEARRAAHEVAEKVEKGLMDYFREKGGLESQVSAQRRVS